MRLSNGSVNARASTSPSKPVRRTTAAEDFLREDGSAWPPLLATFAEANRAAVASFVDLFVTRRIEYKCGQCPEVQFVSQFLRPWLAQARTRVVEMDGLVTAGTIQLTPAQRSIYKGCVERLLSAIRDAQLEMPLASGARDKAITFAQPVAHRIVRHSRDRFSLRSVTDDDTGLSLSPPRASPGATLGSPEPDVEWVVEEVGDGAADVYTARTSGVYYGDVVHDAARRQSTDSYDSEGDESDDDVGVASPERVDQSLADDPLHCFVSREVQFAQRRRRRTRQLRFFWLLIFYAVPATLLAVLLGLYAYSHRRWQNQPSS